MDDFIKIYTSRAADYHKMIRAEDHEGHLLQEIERIAPIDGKQIIDIGTGTGRLPILFQGRAAQITAIDLYYPMLIENKRQHDTIDGDWDIACADMRHLPFPDQTCDILTAGWALGHFCGWYPHTWKDEMSIVLREMQRLVKPGGWILIMETLSTGSTIPVPPNPDLAEYYRWLEWTWGFTRSEISTDYRFESVDDAVSLTQFFFGDELVEKIHDQGWSILPEWTGIWSKQV